jgi:ribose 5-phosphate isomerase A
MSMPDIEQQKKAAARAAFEKIADYSVIGVGTGSTVNYFIDMLGTIKSRIDVTVASSVQTELLLKKQGLVVVDLNYAGTVPVYVDGADEVNACGQMIKGGGGALTREKILSASAEQFICIVDPSKRVTLLGDFPVAVEVIPMARGLVARAIVTLGGSPVYREGFVTDNGNIILDVHHLDLTDPVAMEATLNRLVGVVENGVFASRTADEVLS